MKWLLSCSQLCKMQNWYSPFRLAFVLKLSCRESETTCGCQEFAKKPWNIRIVVDQLLVRIETGMISWAWLSKRHVGSFVSTVFNDGEFEGSFTTRSCLLCRLTRSVPQSLQPKFNCLLSILCDQTWGTDNTSIQTCKEVACVCCYHSSSCPTRCLTDDSVYREESAGIIGILLCHDIVHYWWFALLAWAIKRRLDVVCSCILRAHVQMR